jgi:predicted metalloendopeptidase
MQLAFGDFINGAEWADKTMIERAIQWIESYLFDIGFPDDWCRDSATMKSGKQRFLEAMEE